MVTTVVLAAVLLCAASARATVGALTPQGCFADLGSTLGCGATQQGLDGARGVAMSPNGRTVYVASSVDNAVVWFDRDPATGALTAGGCISDYLTLIGCGSRTSGLLGALGVTVSPDGRSVYAVGRSSNAIVRFDRDRFTGALTPRDCIVDGHARNADCATTTRGLEGASSVAVSADGRSVYVTAFDSRAVVTLDREPASGALTPRSCVSDPNDLPGCGVTAAGLWDASSVAVSPDGRSVYVTGYRNSALVRFDRDTATGALTPRGCVGSTVECSVWQPRLYYLAAGVAVSPDGRSVYAASDAGVSVFTRDPQTGALTERENDCVVTAASRVRSCAFNQNQLGGATGIAVSSDGRSVYVASIGADAVVRLDRDPATGVLAPGACVDDVSKAACAVTRPGLSYASGVAVSPDGRSVYATGRYSDALVRFDRETDTGSNELPVLAPASDSDPEGPRPRSVALVLDENISVGADGAIDVGCALDEGWLRSCTIEAFAADGSHIGHAHHVLARHGTRGVVVTLALNKHGRHMLKAHPQGFHAIFRALAQSFDGTTLHATRSARLHRHA